jgi:hypothetical protein
LNQNLPKSRGKKFGIGIALKPDVEYEEGEKK